MRSRGVDSLEYRDSEVPIDCIRNPGPTSLWMESFTSPLSRHLAFALIAVLALTSLLACGKKGAPMVPRTRDPLPIMDLSAVGRGGVVTLFFTLPNENIDGSPFRDLKRVEVFRRTRSETDSSSDASMLDKLFGGGGDEIEKIFSIDESELIQGKNLLNRKVRLVDAGDDFDAAEDWFGHVFEYFVFTHGSRWRKSPPSNIARAMPLLGPMPPEQVATEFGDSVVKITWQPQTLLTNGAPLKKPPYYNVYGVPSAGWKLKGPLNEELVADCFYIDLEVTNDTVYRYAITTVAVHGELFAESVTSATVVATPADNIAPASPSGLEALSGQGLVNLIWKADEAPDHLGYRVYRKKASETSFMLLTPQPIIRNTYVDRAVFPDVEYIYYVTVIDNSSARNESGPSNTVSTKPR